MNIFEKLFFNKRGKENKSKDAMPYLKIGDRIRLSGGYNREPTYLQNPPSIERTGSVINFIIGQNSSPAALVKLDSMITGEKITGEIVVLELRYVGQTWECSGPNIVHIELCDFIPENKSWKDRKQGEWIEAAASWEKI